MARPGDQEGGKPLKRPVSTATEAMDVEDGWVEVPGPYPTESCRVRWGEDHEVHQDAPEFRAMAAVGGGAGVHRGGEEPGHQVCPSSHHDAPATLGSSGGGGSSGQAQAKLLEQPQRPRPIC